jgi:hypothetical protein
MLSSGIMHRRLVGLHTQSIRVTARDEPALEVADFVCAALSAGTPPASDESLEVAVLAERASSAEQLMRELAKRLVWDYARGLALHAAAVELEGRTLLLPAVSGGGKSTLAVYLAASDARAGFLTDELVFVPLGTTTLHPLARPAHLKPGSLFLLDRFPALAAPAHSLRYAQGALLAPAVFEAVVPGARPLDAIVFPEYAPHADGALERLPPGAATYSLLAALVNARNLPAFGVPECGRLTANTHAFRLRYRTLDEARDRLRVVLRDGPWRA